MLLGDDGSVWDDIEKAVFVARSDRIDDFAVLSWKQTINTERTEGEIFNYARY